MIGGRIALAATAIVLSGSLAACGSSDEEIVWLLVVQGEVTQIAGTEMVLAVPPTAIAFSDRPDRVVRVLELAPFLAAAWAADGTFDADPPNASLVDQSDQEVAVIEIVNMGLRDGLLTISYELLEGAGVALGDYIALTIDDVPTTVNPMITD